MYDIDQERIYSTGMSNGGFFSYKLACELSDLIAAIASVTGTMNANQTATCDPEHPMPVMEIHGTADETVQYAGTFLFASVESVLQYWIEFNDCNPVGNVESIEDTDPTDGSTVEHQLYTNGTLGAEVEHYKIINGGHTWPGSAFIIGSTNQDIDASKEIWRFFSKYDINGLIDEVSATEHETDDSIMVYPNPVHSALTIDNSFDRSVQFILSTIQGQPIRSGVIPSGNQSIPIVDLPQGMYLLSIDDQLFWIVKTE